MKPAFKLSLTLLLNQFLADIASGMCVIAFPFMFGDTVFCYVIYTAFMMFFFYYISYHGAYRVGFHDISRHSSEQYDRGYIKRGITASAIALSPSLLMFILLWIGRTCKIVVLQTLQMPLAMWCLYGFWPISKLIPNHMMLSFAICLLVQFVFPLIGYFCGYRGIVFSQKLLKLIGMDRDKA